MLFALEKYDAAIMRVIYDYVVMKIEIMENICGNAMMKFMIMKNKGKGRECNNKKRRVVVM